MNATAASRYSFTAQFLLGAAILARRAHEMDDPSISEELKSEHMACIVGAITQATAALEAKISEVAIHGPGHHLGSNGIDAAARDFLLPLAEIIDGEPTLRRYDVILHLLRKPAFNNGAQPYQGADPWIFRETNLLPDRWPNALSLEEIHMKRCMLVLAALVTLTAGAITTANAVEFGVGPGGVYVGPDRYHRHYGEYYGGCRTIIEHRINRFGEDVVIRRRICD